MANLRLAAICRNSSNHGPGTRYTVWVQGCDKKCKGCISPEWQTTTGGMDMDTEELALDILTRPAVTGVTISGGEPLLQAPALVALLSMLRRARPSIDVILFTGYTMGQLALGGTPDQHLAISLVDLVIDGPYVAHLNDNKGLRGSSNQTLTYITDRLRSYHEQLTTSERKVTIYQDGKLGYFLSGVPPKGMEDL